MVTEGVDLKKRIFCMILALALILGLAPGVLAAEAGDGTETITAQPSAAQAADGPAALPEQEPLKNVTANAAGNVARLRQGNTDQEHATLGAALGAAMTGSGDATVTLIGSNATVPVVPDVEGGGSIDIQSANEITLDLNGHSVTGDLKIGTISAGTLKITDDQPNGRIENITVNPYGRLFVDAQVSTAIGYLYYDSSKATTSAEVKLTQCNVEHWQFGSSSPSYESFLASGSSYHKYENDTVGDALSGAELQIYAQNGNTLAVVPCAHPSGTLIGPSIYRCDTCGKTFNTGAALDNGTALVHYNDLLTALAAAQSSPNSTVYLMETVTLTADLVITGGPFTLDTRGYQMTFKNSAKLLIQDGADLTLINTSPNGWKSEFTAEGSELIRVTGGRLQIGRVNDADSKLQFSAAGGSALAVAGGTAKLYRGQFNKITTSDPLGLLPEDGAALSTLEDEAYVGVAINLSNPGEALNGTVYAVAHTHTFDRSGTCICGKPCTHPSFDGDGYCTGCGKNFTATLTKDGTSRAFDTLSGAIAEAQKSENKGCTVTLLQTVDLGSSNALEVAGSGCEFTFDLNGRSLGGGIMLFKLTGNDQKLTFKNSSAERSWLSAGTVVSMSSGSTVTFESENITFEIKGSSTAAGERAGTLVKFAEDAENEMQVNINGGTYIRTSTVTGNVLDIDQPKASVTITKGTFGDANNYYTRYAVYVSNGGALRVAGNESNPKFEKVLRIEGATADVKLSGGRYKEIYYGGYTVPGSHLELLESGLAFYDGRGLINVANVEGPSLSSDVYVAEHEHYTDPDKDGRCLCGYLCPHANISESGHCYDCRTDYVVKVENTAESGAGTSYHTRLSFALDKAKNNATITLLDTAPLFKSDGLYHTATVNDKTVTINLNGKDISDIEGLHTLKIASTGAVKFTGSGSVNCVVELDENLTTTDNETAFLGGTFTKIISKKDTVLPALAKANGFAFYKTPTWLTLDGLKTSPLEGYTAYPVPIRVTTPPAKAAEMTYGNKYLPEELRLAFGYNVDPLDTSVGVTWKYSKDSQDLGTLTTAGVMHGQPTQPESHNYKIFPELPVGTYDLRCEFIGNVAKDGGLTGFTLYENGTYTATLTVKAKAATVTKAPTPATGLIFDGTAQLLLTDAGTAEGGKMVFAPAKNGTYMEGIPSGSGAGTYKIWYKVKADANHSDSEPQSVTVTIAPRKLSAQVEDKTMYAGDQLPAFTATYSGFVGNDTTESIVQADTAVFHTDATGKQAGKFDITMTTAPQLNGGNYELKLSAVTKGMLTVNERPRMPKVTKDDDTPESPFDDVTQGDYFFDPVRWAVDEEIAQGVGGGKFAPHAPCTRAQIVTMLWRAAGSPEPKGTAGFADIPAGAYYAKAVAWAAEQGIAAGVGGGRFDPHAPCTRAQAVTLLHRAAGAPETDADAPFADVPTTAYYKEAVAWATQQGITTGVGDGKFAPDATCTRAQIVTMLYRNFKK